MIKITVDKEQLPGYDKTTEGIRYSASAVFKTAIEELADPKSVINALFDAMRVEGYTDYGIIKAMSDYAEENMDIIYMNEGFNCIYGEEDEDMDDFEEFRKWLEENTLVRGIDYE